MNDTPKVVWIGLAVLGVAVVAGGAYWVLGSGPDLQEDLASGDVEKMRAALMTADNAMLDGKQGSETRNLTIEAMKKMSMDDLMELWQGDDLTDEQREALGENLRTIWENHIGDVAEEYFAAAPEEKERILDKQIDEWKEFMDRMRAYHEANKDDPEYQKRQEERMQRWRKPTKEDRKERQESVNPDRQMKMFYMFGQMQKRAQERGMNMWGGPPANRNGEGSKGRERSRERSREDNTDSGRDPKGRLTLAPVWHRFPTGADDSCGQVVPPKARSPAAHCPTRDPENPEPTPQSPHPHPRPHSAPPRRNDAPQRP